MNTLKHQDVLNYIASLQIKPQTINHHLKDLRNYFNYLIDQEELLYNPVRGIEVRNPTKVLTSYFKEDELEDIYTNYNPKQKAYKILLGLVIYQAAEAGTLQHLETRHINLEKGTIDLPGTKRYNSRKLGLQRQQLFHLYKYLESHKEEKVFTASRIDSLQYRSLQQLKQQTPSIINYQQLRTSVIKNWLKTYNLREVQYYCGHRYISSTEAYQTIDMEAMKNEIKACHPLG